MAKSKLNSASVNSLKLKTTESANNLNKLIQAHNPAHQIASKIGVTHNAINLISTHATRVHEHDSQLSLAPRNQIAITRGNFSNLKYAYPASQVPINTSLAKQNTNHFKQPFQTRNELSLATR